MLPAAAKHSTASFSALPVLRAGGPTAGLPRQAMHLAGHDLEIVSPRWLIPHPATGKSALWCRRVEPAISIYPSHRVSPRFNSSQFHVSHFISRTENTHAFDLTEEDIRRIDSSAPRKARSSIAIFGPCRDFAVNPHSFFTILHGTAQFYSLRTDLFPGHIFAAILFIARRGP